MDKTEDRWAPENSQQIDIREEQIFQGNLILVNNNHSVQKESIKSDVIDLTRNSDNMDGVIVTGKE